MHIHNVYFWLQEDVEGEARQTFEEGLKSLTHDPAVNSGYFGVPAGTDRDVVDNTYSYGLFLVFDDIAAHDRYQVGAVHQQFVQEHSTKWKKVLVYDVIS